MAPMMEFFVKTGYELIFYSTVYPDIPSSYLILKVDQKI
jgi:hypothetical protein